MRWNPPWYAGCSYVPWAAQTSPYLTRRIRMNASTAKAQQVPGSPGSGDCSGVEPRSEVARETRTIVVGSGKGGVGKSVVSVLLATAVAARGRRVLLLDGD